MGGVGQVPSILHWCHPNPDRRLRLTVLVCHRRRSCRSVDLTDLQHAPRHDKKFPGQRDDGFAGPDSFALRAYN